MVVPDPVGLAVVFRPVDVELPDPPVALVIVEGAAPVPDCEPMPLPAPPPGDNPLPPVTTALVETEDAELDGGLVLLVVSGGGEEADVDVEVEVEGGTDEETELSPVPTEALVLGVAEVVGPVLELGDETETPLQERSKNGVVLRGLPGAIPKLGLV